MVPSSGGKVWSGPTPAFSRKSWGDFWCNFKVTKPGDPAPEGVVNLMKMIVTPVLFFTWQEFPWRVVHDITFFKKPWGTDAVLSEWYVHHPTCQDGFQEAHSAPIRPTTPQATSF